MVLELFGLLARNGLIENVHYLPPGLESTDIAEFCLPVQTVEEQEWQRLEQDRLAQGRVRGRDDQAYVFAQSEEFWRMNGQQRATPQLLEQVLSTHRRIVLRGEPGEGKTTALFLHVAHRCRDLCESLRRRAVDVASPECRVPLPLWLSKAHAREPGQQFSVVGAARNEVLRIAYRSADRAPPALVRWLDEKLRCGEFELFLDALDELDVRWHDELRKELEIYGDVGVFMTTRLSADDTKVLRNARRYRMVCFGSAQMHDYIQRYFALVENGEHPAAELKKRLELSPGPRHLAQIPLLLSLLCERKSAWPDKPLPESRTKLLEFGLHRLLERGDTSRCNPVDDSPTERNLIKEAILDHVAWRFFATGPLPITKKELLPILDTHLVRFEGDKHEQPKNASALLRELLQDGVLVRQDEGVYRFVLRSLHEYCFAGWFARESPPVINSIREQGRAQFELMIRGRADSWGRTDWQNSEGQPFKPLNQQSWHNVWPLIAGQCSSLTASWLTDAIKLERDCDDLFLSRLQLDVLMYLESSVVCPRDYSFLRILLSLLSEVDIPWVERARLAEITCLFSTADSYYSREIELIDPFTRSSSRHMPDLVVDDLTDLAAVTLGKILRESDCPEYLRRWSASSLKHYTERIAMVRLCLALSDSSQPVRVREECATSLGVLGGREAWVVLASTGLTDSEPLEVRDGCLLAMSRRKKGEEPAWFSAYPEPPARRVILAAIRDALGRRAEKYSGLAKMFEKGNVRITVSRMDTAVEHQQAKSSAVQLKERFLAGARQALDELIGCAKDGQRDAIERGVYLDVLSKIDDQRSREALMAVVREPSLPDILFQKARHSLRVHAEEFGWRPLRDGNWDPP